MLKNLDKNQLPGDETEIFRLLGMMRLDPISQGVREIARQEILTARKLIAPRGMWKTGMLDRDSRDENLLRLNGITLQSQDVRRHMLGFTQGVLLAVTIGNELENAVDDLFARREYTRATILDAAGSQFAEEAANLLTHMFHDTLDETQKGMTRRFSPGYGDWSIRIQSDLLRWLEAEKIGLTCNEASILIPRKSITAIAGYGLPGEYGHSVETKKAGE